MDIDTHNDLETKAGIPLDAVMTHGEMMRAFETFKETNDERVALSDKHSGDVVLEEKLARLNSTLDAQARRLDEITLKSARPAIGGERSAVRSASALEHKAAFESYIRSGEAAGLCALEVKALSAGSNPDGGYLVPPEVETQIGARLTAISPIRSIAGVRTISGNVYKKPFMTAGPAVGWVGKMPSLPSASCWPRFAVLSLVRRKKDRAKSGKRSQHRIIRPGIMIKRSGAVSFRRNAGIGLLALTIAALHYSPARAQSADLVLCDRLAAEPADPDKPADVKGTPVIAPSDIATAIRFCKIASASSRRAMYELGRAYLAGNQQAEAQSAFRKAADKGSSSAMVELGVMYGTGNGVARDEAQARKLFERAAEAGNPRGVSNLAAVSGSAGVSADPTRSRALLAKAAETNAEAQYQLGMMMADGVGGPKDDVAARGLFEKAAAQGHAGALERMGAFAQAGRGGPEDKDAAKTYYEKAAALGNEDAKASLERLKCPYVLRDKRGNIVSHLCF